MKPLVITFILFALIMSAVLVQAEEGFKVTRTTTSVPTVESLGRNLEGWSHLVIDGEHMMAKTMASGITMVVRPWMYDKGISVELLMENTSKRFPVTLTLSKDYVVRFVPDRKIVFEFVLPFVTEEQYNIITSTVIAARLSSDNFLFHKFITYSKGDLLYRTKLGMKAAMEIDFAGLEDVFKSVLKFNNLEKLYNDSKKPIKNESEE